MVDLNPLNIWQRLLALPNESRTKTIAMAFLVSGACALLVSSATVLLNPLQQANLLAERQARMDTMMAAMPTMAEVLHSAGADQIETVIVALDTGLIADIDPATFDVQAMTEDPQTSSEVPAEADLAKLGRRADYAQIHILRDGTALKLVILPISASGYQSTIQANLALEGDLNTVAGLSIVSQGETPGLGARIDEPAWQALWPGKLLADESGVVRLSVVKGQSSTDYEVDGITGATRTSNAVTAAVQFWLGPYGFAQVLDNLRDGTL